MNANANVLIVYRDIPKPSGASNIGLGVSALHTARVLRRVGIPVEATSVVTVDDVKARLTDRPSVTHCVLEAPWVAAGAMSDLLQAYPSVHFLVRCHSQIAFLQVEPEALQILRDLLSLQDTAPNLTVATNSRTLKRFFETAYGGHALYLPNLYDLTRVARKRDMTHASRTLRIGSFGALRVLKNHTTSAAAALMLAKKRGCDLEFWVSVDSDTGAGNPVLQSLRAMFAGLSWAKLVEQPWQDWPSFRQTVAGMDLCLQISMTETFNITIADAVSEGVPCVVSPAIEWAPDYWKAETDRLEDVVRIGGSLLSSTDGADDGLEALSDFVSEATSCWYDYLDGPSDLQASAA
ncbi:MAG: hypothetical protein ACHREM_12750 [Polyangiales bacterium]